MRGRFQNPHEARDALGSIGDGAAEFIRASIHATAEGIVLLCHIVPLMASVVYDATRKERARAAKRFARRRQSPPPPPHIDLERCDDCGLCTAVCPMGATRTQIDHETELTRIQEMEEPMLQCTKVFPAAFRVLAS